MKSERFLNFKLDRNTVAIPAETAIDMVAAHCEIAADYVLDRPGKQVAIVGEPRGKRRPVIEHILRTLFFLPVCARQVRGHRPLEDVLFAPESENLALHFWKFDL